MAVDLVAVLLADVAEGVRVLRVRDGHPLTEEQVIDRARNIVTGLLGNYDVRPLPRPASLDWDDPLVHGPRVSGIPGIPPGHSWSCRCDRCSNAKQKERA